MTAEAVDAKVAIVRDAAAERIADIELNIRASWSTSPTIARRRSNSIAAFVQVDPAMVAESPFALVGSPDEMVDDLLRRRERWGFNYVIVGAADVESFAPVVAALFGK